MPEAALPGGLDDGGGSDPLVFAEKLLGLLDAGCYTATYKFAVLIALIDECVESVDDQGQPPVRVSGLRIGTRVLGLFWPQAVAYRAGAGGDMEPVHLRHSTQPNDLVRVISDYRIERGIVPGVTLQAARRHDPNGLAHLEAQDQSCFYCRHQVPPGGAQVDHFIPWIRHPDDGLDNLVAAHTRCNNNKRDTLASAEHLEAWVDRVSAPDAALKQLRSSGLWPSAPARTLGAARATYLWVPEGTPLWAGVGLYRRADPERLRSILIG